MTQEMFRPGEAFSWGDGAFALTIEIGRDHVPRLSRISAGAEGQVPASPRALPLVDVLTAADGRGWSGFRYAESAIGARMRYAGHEQSVDGPWRQLRVDLTDPGTGLAAYVFYRAVDDLGVLRSWTRLTNAGGAPVTIESVTSFLAAGLPGEPGGTGLNEAGLNDAIERDGLDDLDLYWADNDWLAENRWQRRAVRDVLPDLNIRAHGLRPRGGFGLTSTGSWSAGRHVPMGALVNRRTGHAWLWQIEHNGSWHWQVGEHPPGVHVALLGPANAEHQWRLALAPGESFDTVPVAVAFGADGFDHAAARMTRYRRVIRRPHADHRDLPVVFNDYMNTLKGDPTTEKLLPLISAAARAGAEYFCIDAGWYAEQGEGWWDAVGTWKPSASRFPNGITEVIDRIRAEGMIPGLWLEPEVVGLRSRVAGELPAEAFFQRDGGRVVEHGRYHLDLRHPAAVAHLDEVVDFLVRDLGVGYLKLDYNINAGVGTETGGMSAGAGLLGHNRALLCWLDGVLDRHPGLTLENCASGGMRSDYAMLSRMQLQSTSDQQDFRRYPAIAAVTAAAIAPEQCGNWAYPQSTFTRDEIAFTLCGALLGRLYLSGRLDRMKPEQLDLVAESVDVYRRIRPRLAGSVPFWPLGLSGWTDSWMALGARAPGATYVIVWRRGRLDGGAGGAGSADPGQVTLPIRHLREADVHVRVLFPRESGARSGWDQQSGELTVALPSVPSACLIELVRAAPA